MIARLSIVASGFALALFSVQPALSCHRYAHWGYPWPQRCGFIRMGAPVQVVQAKRVDPPIPDIPVALPLTNEQAATLTDDEQRQMGLDALRPLLDALVNGEPRE